jgi:tetratricopeptide (TPR) repeat protein
MVTILHRVKLGAILLGSCLIPDSLAAQAPAQPRTEPDAAAFRLGLRRVHETMARGRFKYAASLLKELLSRHENHRYVFVHKAELLEDYRRCAFFLKFPAPTTQSALHGRLLKFDPSSGKIAIEYTPATLGDFDEPAAHGDSPRKLTWHPAIWRGACSIELSGRSYRSTVHEIDRVHEIRLGCNVHVCKTDAGHLEFAFGTRRDTHGKIPARAVHWTGDAGETEIELQTRASPARLGAPFVLRVEVGTSTVRATFKNKVLFRVKRPVGGAGQIGIEGVGFDKLTIKGRIDPGWIRDRLDHKRQLQVDEFDRIYDGEEVPDWLAEGSIPNQRSFNPAQAWPADATERYYPILRDIVSFFERSRFEAGLAYIEGLDHDVLPTNTRYYLRARFYQELDEIGKAMKFCERLVAGDPEFITGRQLRAELRVRRGQGEDAAIADYRAMIDEHPNARGLYVDLAVLLIQAGRAKAAGDVLASAVRATGNGKELMALQRMLLCVTRGPQWEKTFEHRSPNYVVRSNISKEICHTATSLLESAHRVFARALGKPRRRAKDPYRVFLFAGRTGYERFCSDILGERDTHTAGLYSAALKQLLIWNLPDQAAMLRTIRHEGFHQYLDSLVHDAPAWLNEGLAEAFETDDPKHLRADHVRRLRTTPLLPTAKFVAMPGKVFYRGSGRNYAQAWALVQFLRHGPETWRPILPALLAALAGGRSPRSAVRVAFRGVDYAALHADLTAWLSKLR